MLTLESLMFPVLGEVSCYVRVLPNRSRNRARRYYYIVLFSNFGTIAPTSALNMYFGRLNFGIQTLAA